MKKLALLLSIVMLFNICLTFSVSAEDAPNVNLRVLSETTYKLTGYDVYRVMVQSTGVAALQSVSIVVDVDEEKLDVLYLADEMNYETFLTEKVLKVATAADTAAIVTTMNANETKQGSLFDEKAGYVGFQLSNLLDNGLDTTQPANQQRAVFYVGAPTGTTFDADSFKIASDATKISAVWPGVTDYIFLGAKGGLKYVNNASKEDVTVQRFYTGVDTPAAGNTPTAEPTPAPTAEPTPAPTAEPTPAPTAEPTPAPTATPEPTPAPTAEPTPAPTAEPTPAPTAEPTPAPTAEPTPAPTAEPTPAPTAEPTEAPTEAPKATDNLLRQLFTSGFEVANFDPAVNDYEVEVSKGYVNYVLAGYVAPELNATRSYQIDEGAVTPFASQIKFTLAAGETKVIKFIVTSEAGEENVYTFTFKNTPAADNELVAMFLSGISAASVNGNGTWTNDAEQTASYFRGFDKYVFKAFASTYARVEYAFAADIESAVFAPGADANESFSIAKADMYANGEDYKVFVKIIAQNGDENVIAITLSDLGTYAN